MFCRPLFSSFVAARALLVQLVDIGVFGLWGVKFIDERICCARAATVHAFLNLGTRHKFRSLFSVCDICMPHTIENMKNVSTVLAAGPLETPETCTVYETQAAPCTLAAVVRDRAKKALRWVRDLSTCAANGKLAGTIALAGYPLACMGLGVHNWDRCGDASRLMVSIGAFWAAAAVSVLLMLACKRPRTLNERACYLVLLFGASVSLLFQGLALSLTVAKSSGTSVECQIHGVGFLGPLAFADGVYCTVAGVLGFFASFCLCPTRMQLPGEFGEDVV